MGTKPEKSTPDNFILSDHYLSNILVENSPFSIMAIYDNRFIYCNPAAAAMLSYEKPESLVGIEVLRIVAPEFHKLFSECLKSIDKGNYNSPVQIALLKSNGDRVYIETSSIPAIVNGLQIGLIYCKDITNRLQAEEARKESEAKNRAILNALPDVSFIHNRDGRFLDYHSNDPGKLFMAPEQFLGKKMDEIFPAEFANQTLECIEKALSSQVIQILEYQLPIGGEMLSFEARIVPLDTDRILSIIRDITERKRAEEALNRSEAKYRNLVDNAFDAIYLLRGKRYEYVNPRFCEITGYSFSELTNIDFDYNVLLNEEGRSFLEGRYLARQNRVEIPNQYQIPIISKTGKTTQIEVSTVPFQDENSVVVLGIMRDVTDRKEAEQALSESETRLRTIIEHSTEMYYIHGLDHKLTYTSPQSQDILGYSPEEMKIKWTELATENPLNDEGFRITEEAIKTGVRQKPYLLELKHKVGSKRICEIDESPVKDETGKVIAIAGACRDVTERIRAEEFRKLNEERLEALIKLSQQEFQVERELIEYALEEAVRLTRSKIGYLHFINQDQISLELFSWSKQVYQECRAEKIRDYPIEQAGVWLDCFRLCQPVIHNDYKNLKDKKGLPEGHIEIHRHASVPVFDGKEIVAVAGIGNKETDYDQSDVQQLSLFMESMWRLLKDKRAEKALIDSEALFRNLIEQSSDGIYLLYDGKFDIVNRRFSEITGVVPGKAQKPDFNFLSLVIPEDRKIILERQEIIQRGEHPSSTYEFRILNEDGKIVEVETSVAYIDYKSGKATIGIVRDISERKQLEEQLRQAIKMESIGRLAGGVAHDFNNILTVIAGNAELATAIVDEQDPVKESLDEIIKSALYAANLNKQLLAFSRKQTLQPRIVDLNDILSDMHRMLRRIIGEDIDLKTIPGSLLWKVKVDPSQIQNVIVNLAVNARDAMPDGGSLTIETQNIELDKIYTDIHKDIAPGEYVLLAVSDNGFGMDKKTLTSIFEPFFTTKGEGKGTGLGLASVFGIIKQSEGEIRVYSEPGEGTTFKIYLPRIVEGTDDQTPKQMYTETPKGTENILLVEDDAQVRELVATILKKLGYKIIIANSSGDAYLLCKNRDKPVDLIISDVIMPGMNGAQLINAIREEFWPEVKVLFISGYTANAIVHGGVLDKNTPYLQKPFKLRDIAIKVREVIDG